jgi:MFS family permease
LRLSVPVGSRGAGASALRAAGADDPSLKRNLTLLTLDGTFFTAGCAFYDSGTVLPALVSTLTDSRFLIGLSASVRTLGWFLPQLVVANLIGHMRFKGRLVVVNSLLHRAGLLVMASILYLYAATRPALALALFFPVFVLASMSEGVNGVPWTEAVANTIPPDRRGRLFANQQVFGCSLAVLNGFLVRLVLKTTPYPNSYVILFLCTFVWFLGSIVAFMGVKEKPAVHVRPRTGLVSYLRSLPGAWRTNPRFAAVMVVRFCQAFIFLSLPFFVLHARANLGADIGTVGLYVSAQMFGSLAGSALAGRVSDHTGNRPVVIGSVLATCLAPVAALALTLAHTLGAEGPASLLFPLVYLLMGAGFGAGYIGFTNYIIEIAPVAERPTFIGLSNTLQAPFALLSAVGGALASWLGYEAVFGVSAVVGLAGVVLSLQLGESRALGRPDLPPAVAVPSGAVRGK